MVMMKINNKMKRSILTLKVKCKGFEYLMLLLYSIKIHK